MKNNFFQSLINSNYKIISIILLLIGAAYSARAFMLVRATRGHVMVNTYLLIIGIIFCVSAIGIYIFGTQPRANNRLGVFHATLICFVIFVRTRIGLLATLFCFIIFVLTFEKVGTIKAVFILSLILGTIWNRKVSTSDDTAGKFSLPSCLSANKRNIAVNILMSCVCAAGIWLVFERVFSLSLP